MTSHVHRPCTPSETKHPNPCDWACVTRETAEPREERAEPERTAVAACLELSDPQDPPVVRERR